VNLKPLSCCKPAIIHKSHFKTETEREVDERISRVNEGVNETHNFFGRIELHSSSFIIMNPSTHS
jgi:hypothetical protein